MEASGGMQLLQVPNGIVAVAALPSCLWAAYCTDKLQVDRLGIALVQTCFRFCSDSSRAVPELHVPTELQMELAAFAF